MIKIVCYSRKEKIMEKMIDTTKFVGACLLASVLFVLTVVSCIGCVIPCCAHMIYEAVCWLSQDVGNMIDYFIEGLDEKLNEYLYD